MKTIELCESQDGGNEWTPVSLIDGGSDKAEERELNIKREFILTELATTFSDDIDFLTKVNKLSFGLKGK
jgi:hypothetical protein